MPTYTIKATVRGPGEAPKREIVQRIAGATSPEDARTKFEELFLVVKYHWTKLVEKS